jgi:hypothetical protein
MKITYLIFPLLLQAAIAFSQTTEVSKSDANDLKDSGLKINTKVFKFGASLGFNYLLKDIYDPVLSPVDNSLRLQKVSPVSFLLSTSVIVNPISSYYRKLDSNGKPVGELYSVPSRLSFVATVNLAQFGASQTASFNKKIDGGLGLGVRLNDDFHLALTAEVISVRQLRSYIVDEFENKPIMIENETMNALDVNDNRLFIDKYYFGFSMKFIYILIGKDEPSK